MAEVFTLLSNELIAKNTYKAVLDGDTSKITEAGQFVNVAVDGFYLRRPISVCDCSDGKLTLIYKVVGDGTEKLTAYVKGDKLDILTGLGSGYTIPSEIKKPLIVGGGVGVPPLYLLAKKLLEAGTEPTAVFGFNSADEVFYTEEFSALGIEVKVATVDGSMGTKGFVTELIKNFDYDYFYSCGNPAMLKAVCGVCNTRGQISLESRMGCGFGACMCCSTMTVKGAKRICADGPVFDKDEIIWK